MIGTFWNLCRACPSMPVDKLHSEYRSTYRWHEYTGPRQEVVRKPPQPVSGNKEEEEVNKKIENTAPPTSGGGVEPALPRRKKNPSLAYRSHDLIKGDSDLHSSSLDRARCLERERERSRRSKSEGPPIWPPLERRLLRSDSDPSQLAQDLISNFPVENSQTSGLKNAISRISTEYRLQFGWPKANKWKDEEGAGLPRKSLSMGAIKASPPLVPVHRKRRAQPDNIGGTAELEPLVSGHDNTDFMGEEKILQESFSKGEKLQISDNAEFKTEYKKRFRPFSQYDYIEGKFKVRREPEPQILTELENESGDSWFSEVIELRKKAGEYKHRGWGTELVPEHIAELYNKQITLWEQVSRRSSLSALSLASSTHRSITKEEKEKENNKKSAPEWPDQLIKSNLKNEKLNEIKKDYPRRSRIDQFVRHHLERTTGVGEEGILHSPTREKLEPVIPRRKDNLNEITKSPQKTQSLTGRSQSAGPNPATAEKSSPKRMSRASHIKSASVEKKQRPTTLDTAPSRTKPNSGSSKGVQLKTKIGGYKTNQVKQSLSPLAGLTQSKNNVSPMANQFKSRVSPMASQSKGGVIPMASLSKNKEKSAEEVDASEAEILTEPVVKSPPEPTRVKSPEQVLMRSPEPVNWTVPLDTGKTFTVTQNVSESETLCRAQSEGKGGCDPNLEPSQSAPPTLEEAPIQEKNKDEEMKSGNEAPVAGTTSGCLEEPSFTFDPNSAKEMTPAEVLEIANARFERFWRKQTNQEKPAQL